MSTTSTITAMDPQGDAFYNWLVGRAPLGTMLHHCWKPNAAQFIGRETITNVRRAHMSSPNYWSDGGANAYAAADGMVYTMRPLTAANWCHGYINLRHPEEELWELAGGDRRFPNRHLFGLETVANFDVERPYGDGLGAHAFETAMRVLVAVHQKFKLPASRLFFHRDAEAKTCPGRLLDRDQVREELAARLAGAAAPDLKAALVVLDGAGVPECAAQIETNGQMSVKATALLEVIGLSSLIPPLTTSGVIHANGRAFVSELKGPCAEAGWHLHYRLQTQGPRLYPQRKL